METVKINLSFVLDGVYKAKDCTDINDCDIALETLQQLRRIYPHYEGGISKRIVSIKNKRDKLKKYIL